MDFCGTFRRLDVPRLGGRASKRLNDRVRRRKWCLVALGSVEVLRVFMGCPWWVIGPPSLDSQLGYVSLMGLGGDRWLWESIGDLF